MQRGFALIGGLFLMLGILGMTRILPDSTGWAQTPETGTLKAAGVVNINTANATQIAAIPGLGDKKSQAVLKYREKNGPFGRVDEIKKVQGIGDKMFEKIKGYLTVKGETTLRSALMSVP